MKRIELVEGGASVELLDLTDDQVLALDSTELVSVRRMPGQQGWEIQPLRKVGAVRIGESLQVNVVPKIGIDRLLFLLTYSHAPAMWRDDLVSLERHDNFVAMIAEVFRRAAHSALEQGLMQGYLTVDESLNVLKGRMRFQDQMTKRLWTPIPLEVTYDRYTVDTAENQLLLLAVLKLLRLPDILPSTRAGLQRLRVLLADVTVVREPPRWYPNRLNARYQPALRLAELVNEGGSFELRRGSREVMVNGFVLNMWKVYETFVCRALAEAFQPYGGVVTMQERTHLDRGHKVPMETDFLWSLHGVPQVVVDAKYSAEQPSGFPNANLYQMLAYCSVYGLKHGHLIYAAGEGEAHRYEVQGSDVVVHCHTLDLSLSPNAVLGQVSEIASEMVIADLMKRTPCQATGDLPPDMNDAIQDSI